MTQEPQFQRRPAAAGRRGGSKQEVRRSDDRKLDFGYIKATNGNPSKRQSSRSMRRGSIRWYPCRRYTPDGAHMDRRTMLSNSTDPLRSRIWARRSRAVVADCGPTALAAPSRRAGRQSGALLLAHHAGTRTQAIPKPGRHRERHAAGMMRITLAQAPSHMATQWVRRPSQSAARRQALSACSDPLCGKAELPQFNARLPGRGR
jgi:hypothetical protein